ncbi:MAG: malto-oligosyltrehalose synthase [Chloroflexi bacterium]|nr:malto-oligosyltrehalose synthase [Chloroflexota bacterium]
MQPSHEHRALAHSTPDGFWAGAASTGGRVTEPLRIPRATYRLQFNHLFTFRDALKIVPYLDDLGISDVYASPFLKAGPDSLHGYDVSDHSEINPAIGTPEQFAALAAALRERGMSQVLDVVPNHMGVGSNLNSWWNDVLENGPISTYASYFDIDWSPLQAELRNKVLLPILGDQYGRVLENGELRLAFRDGAFFVEYYEHILPVAPTSYAMILTSPCERLGRVRSIDDESLVELQSILTAISYLPSHHDPTPDQVSEHNREKDVVKRRLNALALADREVQDEIELEIGRLNGRVGDSRTFDLLHEILEVQAYRLAYWRVASQEINYRRFFDVNTLAALRMEQPDVFAAAHRLIFDILRQGDAHGLRIDHPDGLRDPAQYLVRLQSEYCVQRLGDGVDDAEEEALTSADRPLYVVVEKILAKNESLPADWAAHGTTGYEFMTAVGGLFVDRSNRARFDDLYSRFTGDRVRYSDLIYRSKRQIMTLSLASEINVLAWQLNRLSERERRYRDFTLFALRDALREVIACFPVYRTYITSQPISETDRAHIDVAIATAKRRNPASEPSIFEFIRGILLLEAMDPEDWPAQAEQLEFVQKVQQTTGPVTAKAVEDTSFYIYNRLASLNEVGGEPDAFGVTVPEFHHENAERLRLWPHAMLSTSTHDTKRSEDVRARISVLSELPREWGTAINRWSKLNQRHKGTADGNDAPSSNDEYLLYQIILGAWPLEGLTDDNRAAFVNRIQEYMAKATREAKVHTSWINPNEAYDEAIQRFVAAILDPKRSRRFLDDLASLARIVARSGAVNSLGQALLKLTVPGVPDTYQGNELWDFSLVDPDNRRPVDYALRKRRLGSLQRAAARAEAADASERDGEPPLRGLARRLRDHWDDGRPKLYLTWKALQLRRDLPELLAHGEYLPLRVDGPLGDHLCAFAREHDGDQIIVAVPRIVTRLLEPDDQWDGSRGHAPLTFQPGAWDDTYLLLPDAGGKQYRNLLTGERIRTRGAARASGRMAESTRSMLPIGTLLADFPVILLQRETP